jgi:hypothetical protein
MSELDIFYDRMVTRMDAIMTHLQNLQASCCQLSEPDRCLYNLACAYIEIVPAVELFRDPDVPDGFPAERFVILG